MRIDKKHVVSCLLGLVGFLGLTSEVMTATHSARVITVIPARDYPFKVTTKFRTLDIKSIHDLGVIQTSLIKLEPNSHETLFFHYDKDTIRVIIQGHITFFDMDGHKIFAKTGDVVLIPANTNWKSEIGPKGLIVILVGDKAQNRIYKDR